MVALDGLRFCDGRRLGLGRNDRALAHQHGRHDAQRAQPESCNEIPAFVTGLFHFITPNFSSTPDIERLRFDIEKILQQPGHRPVIIRARRSF